MWRTGAVDLEHEVDVEALQLLGGDGREVDRLDRAVGADQRGRRHVACRYVVRVWVTVNELVQDGRERER